MTFSQNVRRGNGTLFLVAETSGELFEMPVGDTQLVQIHGNRSLVPPLSARVA